MWDRLSIICGTESFQGKATQQWVPCEGSWTQVEERARVGNLPAEVVVAEVNVELVRKVPQACRDRALEKIVGQVESPLQARQLAQFIRDRARKTVVAQNERLH